jgi:2-oxoglutarate dehydrogenase E2 component (dihydrolipoamide succinyltransferase)
MPQMGESIAEGTIVRWIKKVGDKVDRDEPLFEISTDKVDAEIPSPAAGVVSEIRVQEGETVPVNSVVAVIGAAGAAEAKEARQSPGQAPAKTPDAPAAKAPESPKATPQADGSPTASAPAASESRAATAGKPASVQAEPSHYHAREDLPPPPKAAAPARAEEPRGSRAPEKKAGSSVEETIRERSSPLVRKIAKEHDVDISQIRGTGIAGRVTKDDILAYIGQEGGKAERLEGSKAERLEGSKGEGAKVEKEGAQVERPEGAKPGGISGAPVPAPPKFAPGEAEHVERMSPMRKRIAEHMVVSRRTSAHVHSVFEVNFSRVAKIREAKKSDFERAGVKVTYLSFIFKAVVDALRAVPIVNASVDGENIVYHKEINIGIAVALDWGLIVPVVKHADEKNLVGISRAVADLANRARSKQLKPEEVAGGTFTITNPGVFGALFGMPIISQPQVAILGVGNVEKRPVVVDDAIAIRPMAYLTLGYDHRIIDGAVADEFMSIVKKTLEHWEPGAV